MNEKPLRHPNHPEWMDVGLLAKHRPTGHVGRIARLDHSRKLARLGREGEELYVSARDAPDMPYDECEPA